MPRDKSASHIKIMAAAKAEFLEMGYENASMRSIGNRCQMTAAGIYRHCKDKEDLFYQLVSPAKERLGEWAEAHMIRYEEPVRKGEHVIWQDSNIDMMRQIIYPNMEDYHLLIAKSKGTKYENYLHDMTETSQWKMLSYFGELRDAGYKVPSVKPAELHLLLTAYITALFEPVVHNYAYEEALSALDTIEKFFLPGWKQLMGF